MEVAQPLSREGTPTGEQATVDTKQEEPDASATPPPPESQSPEPITEMEPLETYFESGEFLRRLMDNLAFVACDMPSMTILRHEVFQVNQTYHLPAIVVCDKENVIGNWSMF